MGTLGHKDSEETRRKKSESHKGKPHSDEWNKKVSIAKTGKSRVDKGSRMMKRICQWCGVEFEASFYEVKTGRGKFHTRDCFTQFRRGKKMSPEAIQKWYESRLNGKGWVISEEEKQRMSERRTGHLNPAWNGGERQTYCEKWTPRFRERVRIHFNHTCVLCGLPQSENKYKSGKKEGQEQKLCVHHVFYLKEACCDEDIPKLFVTLCRPCHTRTNTNREYWKQYFTELIHIQHGGKCYLHKHEMSSPR
jgi:hypothetical protein